MDQKKHFEKYSKRLVWEGWLRSLACGCTIGFAACSAAAIISWMLELNGLLLPVATLVAVAVVATALFYALRFRPTVRDCAKRLDQLGLEERMITMLDLDGDQSCVAKLQREDAKQVVGSVLPQNITIRVSKVSLILLIVCAVAGVGMTTVSTLASIGLLPTGNELMDELVAEEKEIYISVTYMVEEGGYIEGETDQLVLYGGTAEPVLAVAEDGYVFDSWDDGSTRPGRTDNGIVQDMVYIATFVPLEDIMEDEDDMPSDFGEPMGGAGQPGGPGQQGEGVSGESSDQSGEDSSGNKGAGKYDDWNQIIDGKTYYRTELEQYRDELLEKLENDEELTEEEKAFIKAYLNIV